jgi:hypothetical protein
MPLNIESDSEGGCKKIAEGLAEFFGKIDGVDLSPLTNYLNK